MGLYKFSPDDAERFARERGIRTRRRGNELIFSHCPYCGERTNDKNKFSINLDTGQFHCFRASCGADGNMITLSKDFNFSLGADADQYYRHVRQFRNISDHPKPEPKPAAVAYMESRGISEEVTNRYNITVQREHENILVFLFYDDRDQLQFVKYRKTDFDKTKDSAKEWCERDCKPILFGMNHCDPEVSDTLVLTEGQCFDGSAEVLTPQGWKRLECYGGEPVMQVDESLHGSFVLPKAFIVKRHIGKMVKVEIGGNYETYTTDDHNLVFVTKAGRIVKHKAGEKISPAYHIPTAISVDGKGYADWTDEMFALYLAVSADGTIDHRKGTGWNKPQSERYVRFGVPLERKAQRLREILDSLGIRYSDNKQANGYDSICFPAPKWLSSKYLPYEFATETSIEQKRFILDEMVKWDGNRVNGRNQYEYATVIKHNADVMQLIASTCGYMSTIMSKQNGGNGAFRKSYCYKVSVLLGKHDVSTQQFEENKAISEVDQRVYCVSVDTGMILVRQNNRISVSGNCDSLSLTEAGIPNAVSVPNGANGFTWVPHCWDFLHKFKTLIVFGDHERGHITLLSEMSVRFDGTVKHVRPEDYLGCKDANEILQKHGKQALIDAVGNAVAVAHPQIKSLVDVQRIDLSKLEKFSTGIKSLDRILGGFYLGQLIILTGERGEGKSTLASQFATHAVSEGYNVFCYSGELMDWFFRAWFDAQVAGPAWINTIREQNSGYEEYSVRAEVMPMIEKWYGDKVYIYDKNILNGQEEYSLPETLETAIRQYGCRVIIVDNLMTAMEDDLSTDQWRQQTAFVSALAKLAKQYDALIFLIAHPRKKQGFGFDNDDIAGSSNITNLADVVIRYSRAKGKEIPDDTPLRDLTVHKNRLTGRTRTKDGIRLYFEPSSKRISEHDGDFGWKLGWENQDPEYKQMELSMLMEKTDEGWEAAPADGELPF